MNEIKKADEIVRAMRDYASDCDDDEACFQCTFAWMCDKFENNAPKIIADLIDSLTAQLSASKRREKAAVNDLQLVATGTICDACTHRGDHGGACLDCTKGTSHFEWCGPQAEKGEADGK